MLGNNAIDESRFTFSSLGIFRKILLGIVWIFAVIFILGGIIWTFFPHIMQDELNYPLVNLIVIIVFLNLFSFWIHFAVCKRKTKQLAVIAILQMFPLLNPIAGLIFLGVYWVSRQERFG
ncbi:hypothetical protein ACRN9V_08040 [Shewanella baltica]|uniref:hypothetical protein n=1 Tax=Shewanella baltica TaxID=62322 RepID=UPI003D7B7192